MQFPIQPVPIPQKPEPFQIPQRYDPAGIIMQAAALRQQRELQEQQLQQQAVQNISEAAFTGAHLAMQKREADMRNAIAKASLELAQSKAPLENALLTAHAAYYSAQARLMNDPDIANRIFALTQPGPNGEPPKMSIEQAALLFPRGIQKMPLANAVSLAKNPDMMAGTINLAQQKAAVGTQSFNIIQTTNSVLQQLKILADINNSANRSQFSLINRKGLGAAAAAGDTLATMLIGQAGILAQTEQRLFPQGSDQRFQNVQSLLSPMTSREALGNQIRLMYTDYVNGRNFRAQKPPKFLLPDEQASGLYINDMPDFVKKVSQKSRQGASPGSYLMNLLGHLSGTGDAGMSNKPTGENFDLGGAIMELQRRK